MTPTAKLLPLCAPATNPQVCVSGAIYSGKCDSPSSSASSAYCNVGLNCVYSLTCSDQEISVPCACGGNGIQNVLGSQSDSFSGHCEPQPGSPDEQRLLGLLSSMGVLSAAHFRQLTGSGYSAIGESLQKFSSDASASASASASAQRDAYFMASVLYTRLTLPSFAASSVLSSFVPVFPSSPRFDLLPPRWQNMLNFTHHVALVAGVPDCSSCTDTTLDLLEALLFSSVLSEHEVFLQIQCLSLTLQKMRQLSADPARVLSKLQSLASEYFAQISP